MQTFYAILIVLDFVGHLSYKSLRMRYYYRNVYSREFDNAVMCVLSDREDSVDSS